MYAHAHEQYVLPAADIERGLRDNSINTLDALKNPANLKITLIISASILALYILYYFFSESNLGQKIDETLKSKESWGHLLLRIALGASLIASAYFNSFLGPEIPITSIPYSEFIQPLLYIAGIMILFGFLSELAGTAALIMLFLATYIYKDYMITYLNYFGEFIALIFFGSKIFSIDKILYGASNIARKLADWEIPLIRITYGISVLWPAITIKFLHPSIIIDIVDKYDMTKIKWLFPSDPLLISFGTGALQFIVGLMIIIGFQTRLNSFATFWLYVLSIIFFNEAVWPHYILLALALYLVINNGGKWSVDNWLMKKKA